jgi:hypothetical protein
MPTLKHVCNQTKPAKANRARFGVDHFNRFEVSDSKLGVFHRMVNDPYHIALYPHRTAPTELPCMRKELSSLKCYMSK